MDTEKVDDAKAKIDNTEAELRTLALSMMPKDAITASEDAKQKGIVPYVTQINDDYFVFRAIKRIEWKAMLEKQAAMIQKANTATEDQNLAAMAADLKAEEDIVISMTIYPKVDAISIKGLDAGVVETLASLIKSKSGFNQQVLAIKL